MLTSLTQYLLWTRLSSQRFTNAKLIKSYDAGTVTCWYPQGTDSRTSQQEKQNLQMIKALIQNGVVFAWKLHTSFHIL